MNIALRLIREEPELSQSPLRNTGVEGALEYTAEWGFEVENLGGQATDYRLEIAAQAVPMARLGSSFWDCGSASPKRLGFDSILDITRRDAGPTYFMYQCSGEFDLTLEPGEIHSLDIGLLLTRASSNLAGDFRWENGVPPASLEPRQYGDLYINVVADSDIDTTDNVWKLGTGPEPPSWILPKAHILYTADRDEVQDILLTWESTRCPDFEPTSYVVSKNMYGGRTSDDISKESASSIREVPSPPQDPTDTMHFLGPRRILGDFWVTASCGPLESDPSQIIRIVSPTLLGDDGDGLTNEFIENLAVSIAVAIATYYLGLPALVAAVVGAVASTVEGVIDDNGEYIGFVPVALEEAFTRAEIGRANSFAAETQRWNHLVEVSTALRERGVQLTFDMREELRVCLLENPGDPFAGTQPCFDQLLAS